MLCTVSAVDAKGSDIKESIVSDYEDANELDRCYDVCHRGFGYLTSTDTKSNSNDNVGNKKKFDAATCSYTYQVNDCSRSSSNSNNNTTTTTSTNSSTNNNISGNITTRMDALLYTIIEPIAVEMEVNKYATLIIMNTFDSTCDNNNNAAFFADLEVLYFICFLSIKFHCNLQLYIYYCLRNLFVSCLHISIYFTIIILIIIF